MFPFRHILSDQVPHDWKSERCTVRTKLCYKEAWEGKQGFSRYVSTGELELLGCRVCAFSVLLPAAMLPSIVTLVI